MCGKVKRRQPSARELVPLGEQSSASDPLGSAEAKMQPIADIVDNPKDPVSLDDDEDDQMPVAVSSPHGSADSKPNPGGEQDYWTINRETVVRHHRAPRT